MQIANGISSRAPSRNPTTSTRIGGPPAWESMAQKSPMRALIPLASTVSPTARVTTPCGRNISRPAIVVR